MANERLADLSTADMLEIAARDPRVQLMERLYTDPEAKKDVQKHSKRLFPNASIPEVDIPAEIGAQLKQRDDTITELTKRLDAKDKTEAHKAFRASLVDAGAQPEDVEKIETFMVENELGPKAVKFAVEKFYETGETAEPSGGDMTTFPWQREPREGEKDTADAAHLKRLLNAGPGEDLDLINNPWVESQFAETVRSMQPGRR